MERVVTINLNGNPYQLETPAYDALRDYLDRAKAALGDNPDKVEITRDLEQAVADKCAAYLSPAKSVISADEMRTILAEMGPVEGEGGEGGSTREHAEPPRKRLYRIRDDAKIAGVCAGIGAYFDIDANIIRFLFIIAALFTSGFFVLVYIVMMFLVPSAYTSEEWAAAYGIPFNAQEVIDRAKREYNRFANEEAPNWAARLRAQRRLWREQYRAWRRARYAPPAGPPHNYFTRLIAGLFALVFAIIGAALLIAFVLALFSLLSTQAVFGWAPPDDIPNWLAIVIVCIVYAALSSPIRYLRRSSSAVASGYAYAHGADGFVGLAAVLAGAVLAYQFIPDFREWLRDLPGFFETARIHLNF